MRVAGVRAAAVLYCVHSCAFTPQVTRLPAAGDALRDASALRAAGAGVGAAAHHLAGQAARLALRQQVEGQGARREPGGVGARQGALLRLCTATTATRLAPHRPPHRTAHVATHRSPLTAHRAPLPLRPQLRLDMLKWYCDPSKSNTEARPCVNYAFMNKLKAATSVEERKKLVQDRSSTMPKDDAGRKSLALSSRAAYTSMYQAYCANPSAAPNPDVCTNEPLKRVYANLAKTAGAATPKL